MAHLSVLVCIARNTDIPVCASRSPENESQIQKLRINNHKKMKEKQEIPFIDDINSLVEEFNDLYQNRLFIKQANKSKDNTRGVLSSLQRKLVLSKTGGLCHICGCELSEDNFHCDHIKPYSQEGTDEIDNFLPCCNFCNNYRWNYSPEEIQWILKLGVWLKTKIQSSEDIGLVAGTDFIKDEIERENRRKFPRKSYNKSITNVNRLFPIKGKNKKGFVKTTHEEILRARGILGAYYQPLDIENKDFFKHKLFVISGESSISRQNIEALILKRGGVIKKTLSQKIDFLVIGNYYGFSKLIQVEELNIVKKNSVKIISQGDIIKAIDDGNYDVHND